MCNTTNLIHNLKAELDLTYKEIASRMSDYLGKQINESAVKKYFSGDAGVPLDKIGALLNSLELEAVDKELITIEPQVYLSLVTLSESGLKRLATRDMNK